jgi:23S rRNA pseudouridine2605 synthase
MEIEKGNRFYDENVNRDEFENNFNTFTEGMEESRNENRKDGRPRFVRADSGNRQYTRVERPSRKSDDNQEGYGQERPRRQYNRQSDGQYGQERPYYSQNRQSGYQSRGGQGTYGRSQYGQERPRYNYNQSRQNENSQDTQPRFYRERVQGQDGGQQGGYQRQYRPRQEGGYQRQGGYGRQPYGQGGYQQRGYRKPVQNRPDSRKRIEYHDVVHDPNEEIRLNKYLANAGVCSRREADDFIQAGVVKVNGQTVTELGVKVRRGDNVLFHDQIVSIERKIYILLNKPKDCVTTVDDPQERRTVMDCIKGACKERVYPVGRLDRNTTGVLLLTNDGELATRLTHPK